MMCDVYRSNTNSAKQLILTYKYLYNYYEQWLTITKLPNSQNNINVYTINSNDSKVVINTTNRNSSTNDLPITIKSYICSFFPIYRILKIFPLISHSWYNASINNSIGNKQWLTYKETVLIIPNNVDKCYPFYFNYLKQLRIIEYNIINYKYLNSYLMNLSCLNKLNTIILSCNNDDDQEIGYIKDSNINTLIKSIKKGSIKLKSLKIFTRINKLTIKSIENIVNNLVHLTHINISSYSASLNINEFIRYISLNGATNNNKVESFNFNNYYGLKENGVVSLACCTNLTKLYINSNPIFYNNIHLFNELPKLKELIFNKTNAFNIVNFINNIPIFNNLNVLKLYIKIHVQDDHSFNRYDTKPNSITIQQLIQLLNKFPNIHTLKLGNLIYLGDLSLLHIINTCKQLIYLEWKLLSGLHHSLQKIEDNNYDNGNNELSRVVLDYGISYLTGKLWFNYCNKENRNKRYKAESIKNRSYKTEFCILENDFLIQFKSEFNQLYNNIIKRLDDSGMKLHMNSEETKCWVDEDEYINSDSDYEDPTAIHRFMPSIWLHNNNAVHNNNSSSDDSD